MREPVRRGVKYISNPPPTHTHTQVVGARRGGSGKETCARQPARDQNYYYRGGTAAVGVVYGYMFITKTL